ncbi:MAG: enoyl-CoA hydratase-related protein [Hyphomonadaceae bacterium]
MDAAELTYEVRERVGLITLNRPASLNALTYSMLDGLRGAAAAAERDPDVIALAITGAGRGFCAGLDLGALARSTQGGDEWQASVDAAPKDEPPAMFSHLLRIGKPVIAAVNGVAAGGGFVLAMMSDFRFAAPEASFTTVFSKRGLIAEHGLSWLLPRQIGTSRALDLLMSSRKVDVEEAFRIGLVDRVVPSEALLDSVIAYARALAETVSPRALAVIKAQVYAHWNVSLMEAAQETNRLMKEAVDHPDAAEGVNSFVERRAPRYQPWTGEKK